MADDTSTEPAPHKAPSQANHPSTTGIRPVREGERIVTLDVLRGLAIFGIFMVNAPFFATSMHEAMNQSMLTTVSGLDYVLAVATKVFFEHKFISLFSLLFGVGMAIQFTRANERGEAFRRVQWRRLAVLLGFGLIHGLLLWYGDILFIYGLMGLIAMWMIGLSPRAQIWLGIAGVGLSICLLTMLLTASILFEQMNEESHDTVAASNAATATEDNTESTDADADTTDEPEQAAAADNWSRWLDAMGDAQGDPNHPRWHDAELIAYGEGPMSLTITMRALSFVMMVIFGGLLFGLFPRALGLFLIGTALFKLGFFCADRSHWHKRAAVMGIGIGLPLELIATWLVDAAHGQMTMTRAAGDILHYASAPVLTFGYIGCVCLLMGGAGSSAFGWLRDGLASVGRMALTNYLGSTVLATSVFYWWGLGYFAQWITTAMIGLVLGLFAVQMIASVLWLRAFQYGPIEWLWRWLSYGTAPPMRRETVSPTPAQ